MDVREPTFDEEVWILDRLDECGASPRGFRLRDYRIAVDDNDERVGLGRIRPNCDAVKISNLFVTGDANAVKVKAHLAKHLTVLAFARDYEDVYVNADDNCPFEAVGFREVDAELEGMAEDDGTVLKWLPKEEREDGTDEGTEDEGDSNKGKETKQSGDNNHKYDTSASSDTGTDKTRDDQPTGNSTRAAARRMGFDSDGGSKYDTDDDKTGSDTKYGDRT